MSLIPASHSWNLSHYARRRYDKSRGKHEYFWLYIDADRTQLTLIITPALQLVVLSSEKCVEELIDIWLLYNSAHVHVHRKSVLFSYKWPPLSSSTTMTRSFRIKFHHDNDLNQCLKVLSDYFPIDIYSPDDVQRKIRSTQVQSKYFHAIKDVTLLEQVSTTTFRNDFIRQYLSNCLLDPAFLTLVNKNECLLKTMLEDK